MKLLTLLTLALLFLPVLAGSDAPSTASVAGVGWCMVLRWFMHLARCERLRRETKARWQALPLSSGCLSNATKRPAPRERSADGPPPKKPAMEVAAPSSRPVVDEDARDPINPWRDEWLQEEPFKDVIFVDAGYVHCHACIKGKCNTDLGANKGKPVSDSWKRSQLVAHCGGQKHKHAAEGMDKNINAAKALHQSRVSALESMQSCLAVIIRLVYWLCSENIAMVKLASLYSMVKSLPTSVSSFKSAPANYVNAARCREFVQALSSALKGALWDDILASPFVSVLIDESTDISTSENLIIYFIYLKAGCAVASYVTLRHAPAVDAQSICQDLLSFFSENGLPMRKVMCFCSDGASVMTCCHNGVGARLKSHNPFMQCIHCIAHRLALCCSDAADDMAYPEMAESLVNSISSYFNRSGNGLMSLRRCLTNLRSAGAK